jgi:ribulose-5-phosphate 4-epimerase/fuculose-1-phosphate aldolase
MKTLLEGRGNLSRRRVLALGAACIAGRLGRIVSASSSQQRSESADASTIDDLVAANRILAREGILDGYGHVSVRKPATRDRFLLARSIAPELVTANDIQEYDLDGRAIDPAARASYRERFIHSEIYRARSDVTAIVHCHTPSLIPFAASTIPLRPMYHMSSFIAEGVPVFEIREVAGLTDLLVSDSRLGRALAQVVANKPAALMRGHGAVIVGNAMSVAVGRSIYLDLNARLQVQAIALGGKITYLDPEEARRWDATNGTYDRAWELWKRKAAGQ